MTNRGRSTPPGRTGGTERKTTGSTVRSAVGRSSATTPQRKGINWNRIVLFLLIIGAIGVLTFPLWRSRDAIERGLSGLTPAEQEYVRTLPADVQAVLVSIGENNPTQASDIIKQLQFTYDPLIESIPRGTTQQILAQGEFNQQDALRGARGKIVFYPTQGGILARIEELDATNGPDLRIYLSTLADPTATNIGDDYYNLGYLRSVKGSYNYLFNDTKIDQFRTAIIYDAKYGEIYSVASLTR